MYCCAFLRDELFEEFKKEYKLPEDSYFALLKIDNKKYSYLINGMDEVKCEYSVIKKYLDKLNLKHVKLP